MNAPVEETTVRTRKPRPKPERRVRLAVALNDEGKNGLLCITVGKSLDTYYLNAIPSDWGVAFSVEKIGGTEGEYHVNLDPEGRTCSSVWAIPDGGRCKHADAMQTLMQLGKLPVKAPVAVPLAAVA